MFHGIQVGQNESGLVKCFLGSHDFSINSRKAFIQDIRKFANWFSSANHEPFQVARVTVRDLTDFRDWLRRERGQAVATVNRCLVTLRRLFGWLTDQGHVPANPAKPVKELRRQALAPKGLDCSEVRRLLREVERRHDIRADAIFSVMLYTGCRVSELINLELHDLMLGERSGISWRPKVL
jgi:site-specific recombinase XerD